MFRAAAITLLLAALARGLISSLYEEITDPARASGCIAQVEECSEHECTPVSASLDSIGEDRLRIGDQDFDKEMVLNEADGKVIFSYEVVPSFELERHISC